MEMQAITTVPPHDRRATIPHAPSCLNSAPEPSGHQVNPSRPRTFDDNIDDDDATMVDIELGSPTRVEDTQETKPPKRQRTFFGMKKISCSGAIIRMAACVFVTAVSFGVAFVLCVAYLVIGEKKGDLNPIDGGIPPHATYVRAARTVALHGCMVWYAVLSPIALCLALVRRMWNIRLGNFAGFEGYIGLLAVQSIHNAIIILYIGAHLPPTRHDQQLQNQLIVDGGSGWAAVGIPLQFAWGWACLKIKNRFLSAAIPLLLGDI